MTDTVNIEIDGQPYEAGKGEMVIAVADRNGIRIPRFCYHDKLSVAANCRMCLVEVERAPKPLPACATPVMEGMKVYTRSPLARGAQKSVMEFLLINHPLDCPICDQGGECELQDVAMGYGRDVSRFVERKRVVHDEDIGPLIATDMTRCIHCTRCVRFGEEIAGLPELGGTGRGENLRIGTYIAKSVDSELSGNAIDLCPVGALTNKPFRFRARAWEIQQRASVAPHDGVGSNIHVHVAHNKVVRVIPRENEPVNEVWISDRDRYSHTGLYSDDRLRTPMVRDGGQWRETDWESALAVAAEGIREVIAGSGAGALGALASPSATLEELFMLQKLVRGLGSANVDHRLRQVDFAGQGGFPPVPGLGMSIQALEDLEAVLLVGSNVRKEQPLLNHRLRKAVLKGARVMSINAVDHPFNYPLTARILTAPSRYPQLLAALTRAEAGDEATAAIARTLEAGERAAILLGPGVLNHPQAGELCALASAAAAACGATLGLLTEGANAAGAWLAGAVPHRLPGAKPAAVDGLDAAAMLAQPRKGYLLLGIEPELDCADSAAALAATAQAQLVVALTAYDTPRMREYCHVMLPMGLFPETAGTYVNVEGRWQSVTGVIAAPGDGRPAWKVMRVLGNLLDIDGFDYLDAVQVRDEVAALAQGLDPFAPGAWPSPAGAAAAPVAGADIVRIGEVPIYASDPLVRRAAPLQATRDAAFAGLELSPGFAQALGVEAGQQVDVRQNGARATYPVRVTESVADGCVRLPAGIEQTAGLGPCYGPIEIGKV